jgi:uncharacterized membrane protein
LGFREERQVKGRTVLRWVLAALFLLNGVLHLRAPTAYMAITPDWVPEPRFVVLATGVLSGLGGLGLLFPAPLRRWAGAGLALYALFVWPANFHHAFADIPVGGTHLGWGYHGPRLLLQPLIIWACLWAGEVIDAAPANR